MANHPANLNVPFHRLKNPHTYGMITKKQNFHDDHCLLRLPTISDDWIAGGAPAFTASPR
jgi:hypothetical protein